MPPERKAALRWFRDNGSFCFSDANKAPMLSAEVIKSMVCDGEIKNTPIDGVNVFRITELGLRRLNGDDV